MNKHIETLHSHTIASDGRLTHKEVLDICAKNKIGVVTFTDHDGLPDATTLSLLKANNSHPTKWIIGIEISSGLPKELENTGSGMFHIVGLFVDPTNQALLEHCQKAQEARIVRMQRMVKNLTSLGFIITEADCLKASGGEAVGRPHIVEALYSHHSNQEVFQRLIDQVKKDAQTNSFAKHKYNALIQNKQQIPYELFLGNESYIQGIYVDYLYLTDMDKSVELIRNAGGIAVVAHYHTIKKRITLEMLENYFKANRLDGAETVYGIELYGTDKEQEIHTERKSLRALVQKYNKIASGGADAHKIEDFEKFSKNNWYSNETVGMAETMINQFDIDTTWSSF